MTSHLITRRGRLGTRLVMTSKKGRQGGKGYRQSEGMMDRQTETDGLVNCFVLVE